jgi:hypothetical protein
MGYPIGDLIERNPVILGGSKIMKIQYSSLDRADMGTPASAPAIPVTIRSSSAETHASSSAPKLCGRFWSAGNYFKMRATETE